MTTNGRVAGYEYTVRRSLIAVGFEQVEADAWCRHSYNEYGAIFVIAQALAFRDAGISVRDALRWHHAWVLAESAVWLTEAGWTGDHAALVVELDPDLAPVWMTSGVHPDRVIEYIRADVAPSEVEALEAVGNGRAVVQLLAALRGCPGEVGGSA